VDGTRNTTRRARHDLISGKRQIIRNGGSSANRNARQLCLHALEEALKAIDPYRCVKAKMKVAHQHLIVEHVKIPLLHTHSIFILAVGKAAVPMMRAALESVGAFPTQGILATSRDQKTPVFRNQVEVFRCGHPIPDRTGVQASQRVIQAVSSLSENDLLLCLISGGASAILPAPARGITINDKIALTRKLLKRRATIHEINTIRRHLSQLKGGRLVELCRASNILSLVLSDVPGNHLQDIGSGLTVEDPTSYGDAVQVLKEHQVWDKTHPRVRNELLRGVRGNVRETPKPGDPEFRRVHNFVIADAKTACTAAQLTLQRRKLRPIILSTSIELEGRDMGKLLANAAIEARTHPDISRSWNALIAGGECVVNVTGKGKGGRNQEVALSAVRDIQGLDGIAIAAFGTDGIDGNSTAAGAIVDGNTAERARKAKQDPVHFLARNDSGTFFKRLGDGLITGPTGTNVGDIYLMISLP
jgi:glycerate 2-kinase